MTLPTQLLLLFIFVFPGLMIIYVSLTWWGPLDGTPWYDAYESLNWFDNYIEAFSDERLWGSIGRTLLIMLVAVPAEFLIGLGLAVLFVDSFPLKRVFYSILLMPMMIVPAVAGYMFFMLFQSNGPINQILSILTGSTVDFVWLNDPNLAFVAIMIADIWQWTPLMFLILLAGMLGVPEDQMKAATLLGASWGQKFFRIVLPKMKVVMIIAIVIRAVEAFKLFDVMYVMTKGGPGVATETVSVYIYKVTFFDLEWAYVSAIGFMIMVFLSVLGGVGIAMMARAQRRRREANMGAADAAARG
ncbi:MAG: sugar ABC transporter permease [Alphaproteobacteria bacterium]|nr:sugar ABC transporter permease [Alphaproteobacteria bacterium]